MKRFLVFLSAAVLILSGTVLATVAVGSGPQNGGAAEKEGASGERDQKISKEFFSGLGGGNILSHAIGAAKSSESSPGLLMDLSLERAIELACETHLLTRLAEEGIAGARGKEWQAASALLPHIGAESYLRRVGKENLKAMGFKSGGMIGPFTVFDARFRMTQKLLDLSDLSSFQASQIGVRIAKHESDFAMQKVIFLASLAYLEALRAQSELKAAEADVELAQRLFAQAERQQGVGIATGVDVARAETRVAQETLRAEKAKTDVHDALISLQRVTGVPYETTLRLKDSLLYVEEPARDTEESASAAEENRIEMQIARERVRMAWYQLNGTRFESLPEIDFTGDVGLKGLGMDESARLVGEAMFLIRMPLFESGQISGAIKEARSAHKQQEITYEDLKRQVAEDVHMALWALETGVAQVRASAKVYELAGRELQLAENRFKQGVGDNVEVLNAQTALANARDAYISALNDYHCSRMNLYFSLGEAESFRLQKAEI
ncbi:MAG: TolC family protein [Candidatus Omnitrophota bacterium]